MGFRIREVIFEGRHVPLSIQNVNDDPATNYFTILIGRNGTGKSRFLAELARAFKSFDEHPPQRQHSYSPTGRQDDFLGMNIQITCSNGGDLNRIYFKRKGSRYSVYKEMGQLFDRQEWLPSRVIATTITPSDKFPVGKRDRSHDSSISHDPEPIYRYLGSKNNFGHISSTSHISRVIESLMFASEKSDTDLAGLNHVFELLGYKPRIVAEYMLKFSIDVRKQLEAFDINADYPNYISKLFGVGSRRGYDLEQESCRNPKFKKELIDSITSVLNSDLNSRICTIEIDFESGLFMSGSLDLFRSVSFLRRFGLMTFSDFKLIKSRSNDYVSIRDASSGEQSVVLTVVGIATEIKNNSLIVIDEPEISLHPEWQEKFVELLLQTFRGYSGCHFILATHSPLLLSKVHGNFCSVVTMDDLSIRPAKEFSKKSADYQLAEAFRAPGYRNEYLAREGLAALRLAHQRKYDSPEFKDKIDLLSKLRDQMDNDDPIAQLTDALVGAAREVSE